MEQSGVRRRVPFETRVARGEHVRHTCLLVCILTTLLDPVRLRIQTLRGLELVAKCLLAYIFPTWCVHCPVDIPFHLLRAFVTQFAEVVCALVVPRQGGFSAPPLARWLGSCGALLAFHTHGHALALFRPSVFVGSLAHAPKRAAWLVIRHYRRIIPAIMIMSNCRLGLGRLGYALLRSPFAVITHLTSLPIALFVPRFQDVLAISRAGRGVGSLLARDAALAIDVFALPRPAAATTGRRCFAAALASWGCLWEFLARRTFLAVTFCALAFPAPPRGCSIFLAGCLTGGGFYALVLARGTGAACTFLA